MTVARVALAIPEQDNMDNESYTTAADKQPESDLQSESSLKDDLQLPPSTPRHLDLDIEADVNGAEEVLKIPGSTHSFLFTEPVLSIPFVFSVGIASISYTCLVLALINNLKSGKIPTGVDLSVRIAQYLSILIALLMEDEIPTGLTLLRKISKPYLKSKFPEVSYHKFVISSILRITMGYLFLVNVLVVLIHADGVIEIFYDVLALQFLQMLDDIAFHISKMEVLGKRLQRATMTPYFYVNFQKEEGNAGLKWRIKMFLKAIYIFIARHIGIYFLNLMVFSTAMIFVSIRQMSGYFQCGSITVTFGDEVWRDAIVQWPLDSTQYPPGLTENMVLSFSYFNGVYVKDGNRTHEGRPVYIEQKKSDRTPFNKTAPTYDPYHHDDSSAMDPIKPAEIKYCGGRWVFSHDYIRKSKKIKIEENDCHWLARSPETNGFDLLDVDGDWQVWVGKIVEAEVSIQCNFCSDDADCNLNGVCRKDDGKCDCDVEKDVVYLGTHCEVRLEESCRIIIGEQYNDIWAMASATEIFTSDASSWSKGRNAVYEEYSRPIYSYIGGLPEEKGPGDDGSFSLIYSGSRWFMIHLRQARDTNASEFWAWQTSNYHAFWARSYAPGVTTLVSDPTTEDSPVGVDFYHVGRQGKQFGAFGLLSPAQVDNMTGRGLFRCNIKVCSFCPDRPINKDYVIPDDFAVSEARGYTCSFLKEESKDLAAYEVSESSEQCQAFKAVEKLCCPP